MLKWQLWFQTPLENVHWRGKTNFYEICSNYEQLFQPIQCRAWKVCQANSIDKFVLPRATGILSTSGQFQYLRDTKCFGNGTRQNSACRIRLEIYTNFFLFLFYSFHFSSEISSSNSIIWMSFKNCFLPTVSLSFSGEISAVVRSRVQHGEVPILTLAWERTYFCLQCSNSSWLEKKRVVKSKRILLLFMRHNKWVY